MNFDKLFRNIVIVGAFLVPFIPFIVANSMFFPFITGKNFVFRITTEIMFGAWAILALRNVSYRPRFSWLLVAIISFVAIIGIADMFGVNPTKSMWSNFERMEGFVSLIHFLGYFLVIGTVFNTKKLWTWLLNTTVGASIIMGLFGLVQLSGNAVINQGGNRVDGKFGNATYLAIYMMFHIFITAILLARWRGGHFVRIVYVLAIILQGIMLFYTATRGTILGLLGGMLLSAILIVIFEREHKMLRKIAIGLLAGIVVLVGGFFAVKDSEFVTNNGTLSRFASISPTSGTVQARFVIWGMAWEGIKERPILGYGQENFNLVFNKYYDPVLYSDEPWFDRVHNIIFDWLIAGGFLGLIAYLSIPLLLLYYIWSKRGRELSFLDKSLLTGMIAGYGFHNLFVFDNMYSYVLYFTILAYVYQITQNEKNEQSVFMKEIDVGVVDRVGVPLIILATIFSVYFFNTKGILASTTLIEAIRPQPSPAINLEKFREAIAYDSRIGNQEIREQLIQASVRARDMEDIELRQELFNYAVSEMEELIKEAPGDARHELFLGSLLDSYSQFDRAEPHFKESMRVSPNKQSIRFAVAGNLINSGRTEEAFVLLEETANLDTSFEEAQIMYAVGAIYTGRNELADKILEDVREVSLASNGRLLQAYYNSNQFEKVKDIWTLRVEQNPRNAQNHISLAAIYLQLGQREDAISQIQNVIDMDPNFADQGNYLIQEIRAGRNP